jgi:hypothetical protein
VYFPGYSYHMSVASALQVDDSDASVELRTKIFEDRVILT